jgi:tetratricopeptide (TPR) repeat protein
LAQQYFEKHLEIATEIGDIKGQADALQNQASIDLQMDRNEQALKRLQEAIRLYRHIGSPEADKLEEFLNSPNA